MQFLGKVGRGDRVRAVELPHARSAGSGEGLGSAAEHYINDSSAVNDVQKFCKGVKEAISKAVERTASMLEEKIDCRASGSTAVFAVFLRGYLFIANVGDSRAVLCRESSSEKVDAIPLSIDHKPEKLQEKQRIMKMNGRVEPTRGQHGNFMGPPRVWIRPQLIGGLAVSRAFGDTGYRCVGVTSVAEVTCRRLIPPDKFVILGSDGIWDVLTNQEVVAIANDALRRGANPQMAARAVVNEARGLWKVKGGGMYIDDITAVLIILKN
eukprot:g4292.t1